MATFVDIHALHTVPPSNMNRDDTGAPKTAVFGGVVRHRVSSQAWKHAIRKHFKDHFDASECGVRSRRLPESIIKQVVEKGEGQWDKESAKTSVEKLFEAASVPVKPSKEKEGKEPISETRYLLFLSSRQIKNIVQWILDNPEGKPTKKLATELFNTAQSVDIAMFGRMLAGARDFNVDASVQVAHALGVGQAEQEFDYFTAVDDEVENAEETGAGMISTNAIMSSTLYRYATVDVDGLAKNLGDGLAADQATVQFVSSFIESMPTGKQNSYANRTLPEAIIVTIRTDRPVSYVGAFEDPVVDNGQGRRGEAAKKLAREIEAVESTYANSPLVTWVIALPKLADEFDTVGTISTLPDALEGLSSALAQLREKVATE
ncbi:type I-E CRISPR-associated protein Cas7/Cse4/CasC [Actinotignum urinale]|uniref:Type I-E CRISPR-associated protein Cas7/Cse4/CasC n=1 Tax=Actinotignum urinale TaxID=190146 RepID=A0AAW9HNR3_9ACTO|nr:type I-E CRISPR-associated protein Cas7/Cse4/CasC [Actinotignum urinale]MDY5155555.1 type I-E CRISPR-associated protein Cas7/Cse4/CasC [Actinotignum urinale]